MAQNVGSSNLSKVSHQNGSKRWIEQLEQVDAQVLGSNPLSIQMAQTLVFCRAHLAQLFRSGHLNPRISTELSGSHIILGFGDLTPIGALEQAKTPLVISDSPAQELPKFLSGSRVGQNPRVLLCFSKPPLNKNQRAPARI